MFRGIVRAAALVAACGALARPAAGVSFTSSYLDGGSWGESGLYVQGFNPFVHDGPDPGLVENDTLYLNNFRFFKSGLADTASNIKLAIVSNVFMNLGNLTTDSTTTPEFVGISTNTIPSTAGLATGAPFDFQFSSLPLVFNEFNNYAAIFVNESAGVLTPILVSTLRADYVETPAGSGIYLPESNYGDPDPTAPVNDRLAVSNFTHGDDFGTFFDMFTGYADANFVASFSTTVPGDYDSDNDVDADDLAAWKSGFGTAVHNADGDGDGDVDGADFLIWQRGLGGSTPVAAVATTPTPEPCAATLAACAAVLGLGVSRRHAGRRPPLHGL